MRLGQKYGLQELRNRLWYCRQYSCERKPPSSKRRGIINTVREGGVGLTALVRIKVSPGAEIGSFASEVTGWDGIEIIYEVSGSADLVALVHVDDTMALRTLLDKMWLAAPNEIASTTTELVLEQY